MKAQFKLVCVILLIALTCGAWLLFSGCTKEEEIPWYEDRDNLEFVLEDERSEEKSYTYTYWEPYYHERVTFHYTYNENDTEEYIPKMKILHKGIEQTFYTYVYKREWFYLKPDGFDYDDPHISAIIKTPGAYRVNLHFYLERKPVDKGSFVAFDWIGLIAIEEIYITVKGEA